MTRKRVTFEYVGKINDEHPDPNWEDWKWAEDNFVIGAFLFKLVKVEPADAEGECDHAGARLVTHPLNQVLWHCPKCGRDYVLKLKDAEGEKVTEYAHRCVVTLSGEDLQAYNDGKIAYGFCGCGRSFVLQRPTLPVPPQPEALKPCEHKGIYFCCRSCTDDTPVARCRGCDKELAEVTILKPAKPAPKVLLPCPFCGGEAHYSKPFMGCVFISCGTCQNGTAGRYTTESEARAAWNRRTP